jgi:hypothetical protein
MTNLKSEYIEKLLKTIQISNKIVCDSIYFENKTKEAFVNLGNHWTDKIEKESFSITQLKSVTNDILTYWKESIGIDTELFWIELQKNNIDFERKDELNFALEKGRFRRVDIGICARKDWSVIKDFNSIKKRFSLEEIDKIDLIVAQDEETRIEILKKSFKKNEIPQTQYLKFGEGMAYANNCGLFDKYFNEEEVEKLYIIWKNFRSK